MLTLTRLQGEEIVVGEGPGQIVIRVTQIKGEKVRLAIDAHRSIPIHRREVYDQIQGRGVEVPRCQGSVGDPGRDLGVAV